MDINLAKTVTYDRARVPSQLARPPLKTPRNQTAAMMLLQQLSRSHRWWTRGTCPETRLPVLVSKFDTRFGVLDPARTRSRKRSKKQPSASLVVCRQRDTDRWLWWLLFAGPEPAVQRLASRYNETLFLVGKAPLQWADEYELRPGPRGSMTWWLTRSAKNDVEAELRYLASAHGRRHGPERSDDLIQAVTRARNRPMFAGVRRQVGMALYKSVRAWKKTHRAGTEYPADASRLPWFAGGVKIYDDPPAVIAAR